MDFLKIDCSYGEGGGQIIRSAITLSCITERQIHLENIRKNRRVSGLRPQHLTAIKILQKISNAKVIGADIGSTELKFMPGAITDSELVADVGTAGSISLILQVLVPVVSILQKKLDLKIKGGTDVLWSPTMEYTQHVIRKAYSKMGVKFSLKINRRGYYPKGGGEIELQVYPSIVSPALFSKRETCNVELVCSFSKIPCKEIESEVKRIKKELQMADYIVNAEIRSEDALDSGASLLIYSIDENSINGIDALYNKKTHRFDVDIKEFEGGYSVDNNLADMLVVLASLCKGKTIFQVKEITKHLETNLFVTSKITGCRYGIGKTDTGFEVIIEGALHTGIKQ